MKANDVQVGGGHYQSNYQHWDFVQDALGGQYLEGCITKYVSRWRKKNGLQDLHKAQHYLAKLKELAAEDYDFGMWEQNLPCVERFCTDNKLDKSESRLMMLAASWRTEENLQEMAAILNQLCLEALSEDPVPWAHT